MSTVRDTARQGAASGVIFTAAMLERAKNNTGILADKALVEAIWNGLRAAPVSGRRGPTDLYNAGAYAPWDVPPEAVPTPEPAKAEPVTAPEPEPEPVPGDIRVAPEGYVGPALVSKTGEVLRVAYTWHEDTAYKVMETRYGDELAAIRAANGFVNALTELCKRGWVRIGDAGKVSNNYWSRKAAKELSQAQLDAVMDMFSAALAQGNTAFAGELNKTLTSGAA